MQEVIKAEIKAMYRAQNLRKVFKCTRARAHTHTEQPVHGISRLQESNPCSFPPSCSFSLPGPLLPQRSPKLAPLAPSNLCSTRPSLPACWRLQGSFPSPPAHPTSLPAWLFFSLALSDIWLLGFYAHLKLRVCFAFSSCIHHLPFPPVECRDSWLVWPLHLTRSRCSLNIC